MSCAAVLPTQQPNHLRTSTLIQHQKPVQDIFYIHALQTIGFPPPLLAYEPILNRLMPQPGGQNGQGQGLAAATLRS